eukprot:Gregarina_sp_Poly_1__10348@NODE_736_length_6543_cov_173_732705_g4_i1_p1_GENE_NODE_736_length_6543_cov_173_732705_g4_i1NODE_736_length_6543_cov_173_732705_g4_i1_p1_ORF_typecomplete_len674_score83_54Cyclin_N/PF00134_23/3e15Cyclin_N/PF00134_23/1_2e03Cyclin_C/PF02984_19/6_8e03Cyclin_C/PF02984_19/0_01Cyclin_C/PF02984_19/1_3e04Cyclin/PF08613_11/0_048Dapper/PF15268_6/28Dapper/PF15268_6/8_3HypA/PF01155_19/1_1e04HypA/PF01155_19/2HypA/PF01155_19/95_NODE_736_length_6543_cov_173_732705_g4_i143886409
MRQQRGCKRTEPPGGGRRLTVETARPLLKKRRLTTGGDGLLLSEALGLPPAPRPPFSLKPPPCFSFPSPRPPKKPKLGPVDAVVSSQPVPPVSMSQRDSVSPGPFFGSTQVASDRLVTSQRLLPSRPLASCHTAYCAKCLHHIAHTPNKLSQFLADFKLIDAAVFQHRLRLSQSHRPLPQEISRFYNLSTSSLLTRCQVVGFMIHCQRKLPSPLSPNTFHLGLSLFDRFVLKNLHIPGVSASLPSIAGAALIIASKMEDVWSLHVDDLTLSGGHLFTSSEILYWEIQVLQGLDFNLSWPTAYFFLTEYIREALELASHQRALEQHCLENDPWGIDCRCTRCKHCGKSSELNRRPFVYLSDLGSGSWNPKFKEGRGRLAIHACALYVLDVILCHPESLRWEASFLASMVLLLTIEVLNRRQIHRTIDLLPSAARSCVSSSGFVKGMACVTGIVEEHFWALDSAKCLDDPKGTEVDDVHFQEALAEMDPKERQVKFTVYFMLKANREGKNLRVEEARKMACRWLEEMPVSNEEGCECSDCARSNSAVHISQVVSSYQEPTHSEKLKPLGKYALDVYAKHRDAAGLFIPRFKEWTAQRMTSDWTVQLSQRSSEVGSLDELKETQGVMKAHTRAKSVVSASPLVKKSRLRRQSCPPTRCQMIGTRTPVYHGKQPVSE